MSTYGWEKGLATNSQFGAESSGYGGHKTNDIRPSGGLKTPQRH
jgi:hypothetical protein